ALHRGLTKGPLQRVVRPGHLPGARARWWESGVFLPPAIETTPVRDDAVLTWADRQAQAHLDPEDGPTWALAAAPTVGGGALLSFVTSHVVADGGMHVGALQAAVAAAGFRADDPDGFVDRRLPREGDPIRTGLVADPPDATRPARPPGGRP